MTQPSPVTSPYVAFSRMLTSGVNSTPTIIFEPNVYEGGIAAETSYPCLVSSILLSNTSSDRIIVDVYAIDGSVTPEDETLARTHIIKGAIVEKGNNLECLTKDIFLHATDKIIAESADLYQTFDAFVSFNDLIR